MEVLGRRVLVKLFIVFSLPSSILISLFIGNYPVSPSNVVEALLSIFIPSIIHSPSETVRDIILLYRLPRVLAAAVVGIALSTSGAALQSMFRNPLVSPYILGVEAGAGFGAALAIAFLPAYIPVEPVAMVSALLAFMLVLLKGYGWGGGSIISLILSGMIVNAFFSAALSLVKYFAPDPNKVAAIVFWLMGDVGNGAWWPSVFRMFLIMAPCVLIIVLARWRLNILSLGDEEAKALGVNPLYERTFYIILCAIMVASAVSHVGIIGWVGLIVPHIIRCAVGADNREVVVYAVFLGGAYMVLADDLSRCLTTEVIPIGVLTTLMGAPLLIYMLRRAGRVWR